MTITEFYEDYSTVDPYTIEYTLDMVFSAVPQIKGNASLYPDAFALFCILHELGHWNHFLHCCKKVYDYISDSEIRKKVFDEQQLLQKECQMAKEISDTLKEKVRKWMKKYHNIPGEIIADDYAREHFKDVWTFLQASL